MVRKVGQGLRVALVALGTAVAVVPAAAAAPAGPAYVRVAHFSPDTASVDVYLTSFSGGTQTLWLSGVGYGAVSPYRRLAAGIYAVSLRPHGAARSTPPVLTETLHARPAHAYTAAGVGIHKNLHAILLSDELTAPGSGRARIRLIQAADRAPSLAVRVVHGSAVATGVRFATTTGYRTVPAGTWHLRFAGGGLTTDATVSLRPNSITSLVVLDAKDTSGLSVTTVLDAAGAAAMPSGPVPAGGGGTAVRPAERGGLFSAGLVALLMAAAAAALVRRRPVR